MRKTLIIATFALLVFPQVAIAVDEVPGDTDLPPGFSDDGLDNGRTIGVITDRHTGKGPADQPNFVAKPGILGWYENHGGGVAKKGSGSGSASKSGGAADTGAGGGGGGGGGGSGGGIGTVGGGIGGVGAGGGGG